MQVFQACHGGSNPPSPTLYSSNTIGSSPIFPTKKYNMWLLKSNRKRHLLYAIPAAFIGTILYSTGLAFGMEFKDKQYGGKFDWLDIAATEIGGLIGQILQIGLIYLIYIIYGNT